MVANWSHKPKVESSSLSPDLIIKCINMEEKKVLYREFHSSTLRDIVNFLNVNEVKKDNIVSIQKLGELFVLIYW